jgi:hypothetical protein
MAPYHHYSIKILAKQTLQHQRAAANKKVHSKKDLDAEV